MTLPIFEDALRQIQKRQDECDFTSIIRESREAIGLKQYRAAQFVGVTSERLKNLESGYFRDMPTQSELRGISRLYYLRLDVLEKKARKHCEERSIKKKVRLYDDEGQMSMHFMRTH